MPQTPLCRMLGIQHPIFSVGMSWLSGPELTSAVSNAGACGVVGVGGMTGDRVRQRIRETRAMTDKPFGANIILARTLEGQIEACLDEAPPLIVFFWGDRWWRSCPTNSHERAKIRCCSWASMASLTKFSWRICPDVRPMKPGH